MRVGSFGRNEWVVVLRYMNARVVLQRQSGRKDSCASFTLNGTFYIPTVQQQIEYPYLKYECVFEAKEIPVPLT